jgi:excisionase family DNA binding protein
LEGETLISLSEAAVISKLHPDHLRKLCQRGMLRAKKIGRNWVTSREAVSEYMGDIEKRSRNPHKRRP